MPALKATERHCPMYSVSCILYLLQQMSLFFIVRGCIPPGQTSYSVMREVVNVWTKEKAEGAQAVPCFWGWNLKQTPHGEVKGGQVLPS